MNKKIILSSIGLIVLIIIAVIITVSSQFTNKIPSEIKELNRSKYNSLKGQRNQKSLNNIIENYKTNSNLNKK